MLLPVEKPNVLLLLLLLLLLISWRTEDNIVEGTNSSSRLNIGLLRDHGTGGRQKLAVVGGVRGRVLRVGEEARGGGGGGWKGRGEQRGGRGGGQ